MGKLFPDIAIGLIVIVTTSILYFVNKWLVTTELLNSSEEYSWIRDGILNVFGYLTLFLPGWLVYKYVRKINYLNKCINGVFVNLIRICFIDEEIQSPSSSYNSTQRERTQVEELFLLIFYFLGLQISYLSWGVLQEKVMTQQYISPTGEIEYFRDSQFLVFVNRVLAFFMSGIVLICRRQPRHKCPLYKYVFCSFSNIMSSWCQYEALKFVSFPHQVLSKAAKTIPVMIMGKIISRTQYEFYEYVTAVMLSIGMLLFMLDTGNDRSGSTVTTCSGVILLCAYIGFDSFTSNWQGALFKQFSMKPVQMMCFVNLFSCMFTAVSIAQQDGFLTSFDFMLKYPTFVADCVLISICSASGQLFIYSTVAAFGPLVFAIISTIRQSFSVILSCIMYNHQVNTLGVFGVCVVFFSVLLRIYCGYRLKSIRKLQNNVPKTQKI